MIPSAQPNPHGLIRLFYHEASDRQAPTLQRLFEDERVPCRLDADGLLAHLGLRPLDDATTCFAGVKAVRQGCVLRRRAGRWAQQGAALPAVDGDLLDLLASVLDGALTPGTAVALGGGLDSALLLAVIRRVLGRSVPVFSLCPRIAGYSEREAIIATARGLGVEPELIEVDEHDFVEALSDCVGLAEVPLYNLHPVSKLLLARALKERGVGRVITGDAADQVFAGVPGSDYLPIVGALFAGAGVGLVCPFLDPRVAAWGMRRADPAKSPLRQAARRLLPASTAEAPKVAQLAPEMDLADVAAPRELELALRALFAISSDGRGVGEGRRSDVRAVTLALLFRHFPRLRE